MMPEVSGIVISCCSGVIRAEATALPSRLSVRSVRVSGAAGLYIVAAVLIIISFIFLFKDTISIFAERSSRRSGFLVQDEEPAEKRQKKKEKPAPVPEPEDGSSSCAGARTCCRN